MSVTGMLGHCSKRVELRLCCGDGVYSVFLGLKRFDAAGLNVLEGHEALHRQPHLCVKVFCQ